MTEPAIDYLKTPKNRSTLYLYVIKTIDYFQKPILSQNIPLWRVIENKFSGFLENTAINLRKQYRQERSGFCAANFRSHLNSLG